MARSPLGLSGHDAYLSARAPRRACTPRSTMMVRSFRPIRACSHRRLWFLRARTRGDSRQPPRHTTAQQVGKHCLAFSTLHRTSQTPAAGGGVGLLSFKSPLINHSPLHLHPHLYTGHDHVGSVARCQQHAAQQHECYALDHAARHQIKVALPWLPTCNVQAPTTGTWLKWGQPEFACDPRLSASCSVAAAPTY